MADETFTTIGDFEFLLGMSEEDTPRPLISILRGGEPFLDLHGNPVRKVFPIKASSKRMLEFCRKFAENEQFRSQTLVRNAFSCC